MPKFSRSKKFNKTNIAKVPENKAIIYEILNAKNKNLYTGIAGRSRAQDRLSEHLNFKKDHIPGGTKFKIVQVKNKDRAEVVEKQIIKKEKPKFNEQNKRSKN